VTRFTPALVVVFACGHPARPVENVATSPPAPPTPTRCSPPSAEEAALVATLDADYDPLHSDFTPSVFALAAEGRSGACAVFEQLLAADADTRLHAQRVFETVLAYELGFRPGRGFRDQYGEDDARRLGLQIGYDYDAPIEARRVGADGWRRWLDGALTSAPTNGPAPAEMTAALDAVAGPLQRCGDPVDLTVTFEPSGRVSSIWGSASTDASYRQCLSAAVATVTVRPFLRASVWTRYPW